MPDLPPIDPAALEAARARTVHRGRRLRRRRQARFLGGTAAAAVVVVGGVLAVADGPEHHRPRVHVVTTADEPTTVASGPTTTTTVTVTTATTEASEAPPPTAPADEPRPGCSTVTDGGGPVVDDWTRYWQTEPAPNDPMTIELCLSDLAPAPGQPVRLDVTIDDPDGGLSPPSGRGFCSNTLCEGSWSNGADLGAGGPPIDYQVPRQPIPTPPEVHGHATWTSEWAYADAGTYTVTVTFFGPGGDATELADNTVIYLPSPYRSVATATLTVTVG